MASNKITQLAKAAVNVVDGHYVNFVSNLGTARDKASHGQFVKSAALSELQLDAMYQDWLAKRIVNRPVKDMLRAGWTIEGLDDLQQQQLRHLAQRIDLVQNVLRLLTYVRLYGKGYLLFGTADGLALDQALPTQLTGRLQYMTVVKPSKLVPDHRQLLSPEQANGRTDRYAYYKMSLANGQQVNIHHTRLMIVEHGDSAESVLQEVQQTLLNYASTQSAAVSLVHEAKIDVIRMPNLMNAIVERTKDTLERFQAAAFLKGINGMLVIDKEEEYQSKTYSFAGLPELMREFAVQTAGAADIPYTILFGQSPAGMNATGEHDTRNYYDRIATDQEWILRPILQKLYEIMACSLFGQVPESFQFYFNPLWQLDPKTRSEIEKANAERDQAYLQLNIIRPDQIARQLRQDGTYNVLDDAHLQALAVPQDTLQMNAHPTAT